MFVYDSASSVFYVLVRPMLSNWWSPVETEQSDLYDIAKHALQKAYKTMLTYKHL